jgi:caa(3)-type oxidase subunit IV
MAVAASGADHADPNYIAIFIYLTVLTVLELAVAYAPIPKALMVGTLVGLAWTKAVLVAMYFMHLRFERRTLAIIAIVPALLVTELTFALLPDLSTRIYAHTKVLKALEKDVKGENPNAAELP